VLLPATLKEYGAVIHERVAEHGSLEPAHVSHGYKEFSGGHDWPSWQHHLAATLRHTVPLDDANREPTEGGGLVL
jgi:enterochelin esterase-like enzyme